MKSFILAFMLGITVHAQAMTDIQSVPLNHVDELKDETLIFKSDLAVTSLSLGAVDISAIGLDGNGGLKEYLIKGPVINNPYLKSFMADDKQGVRQRLFIGVEAEQNSETVASGVADAICKQMSPSKDFSVIDYKMTQIDVTKEAKIKTTLSESTYWNNIFFTFDSKGGLSKVSKTVSLKFFKDIKNEAIYSLTHITCGKK